MPKHLLLPLLLALLTPCFFATVSHAERPTPVDVWKDFDPDAGDFREEIIKEETAGGIYYRESYISAYVNGEEIRVYCKYRVKAGATNAPGLMDVHGWMGQPNISRDYVNDGWAVMAHDYCGKAGNREHYTRYPESLSHGNMDKAQGGPVWSHRRDRSSITDVNETSDYMWYAIQRRVLSYLLAQKEVDPTRIGAKGYSYGGTIMWNLGMDERVKAIVAYFGIGWLEYYRTNSVWMYNKPYREPEMSPGQELYLSAIAPQAHAPHIRAASLWLNGTNDHHGGQERGEQTFSMFQPGVPWAFAHQARGHHNTEKLGNNCKLWLEKHVLGKDVDWPARPQSEIRLDAEGVPELRVTPANPSQISELKMYYALKNPVSFGRAWRDATAVREGDTWVAKMPVMNVDDYVFGFAHIKYAQDIVVTSDFDAAIPSELGNAVATDEPSTDLSSNIAAWTNTGPVEGVGGIMGFRALNNRGTRNEQFSDPKWKAPPKAQLTFKFYCTQPQSIDLVVNSHNVAELEIPASNDWQSMTVNAKQVINRHHNQGLGTWTNLSKLEIKPKAGSDLTKIVFADFAWDVPEAEAPKADANGRVYLTQAMASDIDSFWRVMQDKGVEGKPISISGQTYERGLGVHAPSELTFPLSGRYKTFHVIPGPDDAHNGIIELKILVDGKEVFASGNVRSSEKKPAEPLALDVTGAKELQLIVTEADGQKGGDHASWAEAYLVLAE